MIANIEPIYKGVQINPQMENYRLGYNDHTEFDESLCTSGVTTCREINWHENKKQTKHHGL
jgi:hypothetical protein